MNFLLPVTLFYLANQIGGQAEGPPSNKCEPGTLPTEMISTGGQLTLNCHKIPNCPALAQGTATCTGDWTSSCASTSFVGAIRFEGTGDKGTAKYAVQCCHHPGINQNNLIRVVNRFLTPDDSFSEDVEDNILKVVSNVFDVQNGKHIIQMTKIRCS